MRVRKTELVWGLLVASVFAALAISRRWVHDDGFINLRIVRNLVDGYGPVFNPGERVEAGTSPLWLALLALLHALHAPLEWTAVVLGIVCMTCAVFLMPFAQMPTRIGQPRAMTFDGRSFPVGIVAFAVVPAAWDYASAGLETGLACLWIVVAALLVSSIAQRRTLSRQVYLGAFVCGLGPLIRPDFLVYTALFLLALGLRIRREDSARLLRSSIFVVLSAFALPGLVEILRMGYYGTLAPNTALAKEAFRLNVPQGVCYVRNFVGTYWLAVPLVALSFLSFLATLRRLQTGRFLAFMAIVPMLGAIVHAGYLTVIGGDYMHARLLLPDLIAFAVPLSLSRFSILRPERPTTYWPLAAAIMMAGWASACLVKLRPAKENVCAIGDEHGWYTRLAENPRPVVVDDYRRHPFYKDRASGLGGGRILVYEKSHAPLAASVDAHIARGLFAGAIGITGYSLPSSVFLVDKHGLADPVVARFELLKRERPGHEKAFTRAWVLARFAEPRPEDSGDVQAARHALSCGTLGDLMRSVSAPLTSTQFFRNVVAARAHHALRIPVDPFDAEAKFCGSTLTRTLRGGAGGEPFTGICPPNAPATGLRVAVAGPDHAIGSVGLLCGTEQRPDPIFGELQEGAVTLLCPPNMQVAGIFGEADDLVRRLGAVCASKDGHVTQTSAIGIAQGTSIDLRCGPGARVGITGRAGSLIDALGVACVHDRP